MNLEIINIVLQIIIIIAMISVFFTFKNTIASQKDTIKALKDHLEAVKIHSEIFDPQKIKALVDLKEENSKEKYDKMKTDYEDKLKTLELRAISKDEIVNNYRSVLFFIISSAPSFYFSKESILELFSNNELRDEWIKLFSTSGILFTENISAENYKHFLASSRYYYNLKPWYYDSY
jgi:hypothetical protein